MSCIEDFYYIVFLRLYDGSFAFQNDSKNLDPSYKTDLEFLELFWVRNHKTNLGILGQSYEEKKDRFITGEIR